MTSKEYRIHQHDASGVHSTPGASSTVSGWRLLLALALWIGIAVVVGTSTIGGLRRAAPHWGATDLPIVLVVLEVYAALVLALLLAFGGGAGIRHHLRFRATSIRDLVFALWVWAVVLAVALLVSVAVRSVLGSPPTIGRALLLVGSDYGRLADANLLVMLLILVRACVVAPLAEELFFRGAVFGWLRGHLAAGPTIVVTAALFAAIHMDVQIMPFAFILGIGTAWVRERTGSTLPLVVAHVANNTALVILAYVVTGWAAPA